MRRTTPPSSKRPQFRRSARVLTAYIPYLIRRWLESGADSARTVYRFMTRLQRAAEAGHAPAPQRSPYTRLQGPPDHAVSFAMEYRAAKRSQDA